VQGQGSLGNRDPGCFHNNQLVGGFGGCEVLSFHATKFLNSFESGPIVTNNDDLADKVRLMMHFGPAGYDHVFSLGAGIPRRARRTWTALTVQPRRRASVRSGNLPSGAPCAGAQRW
jgi:hypothetical protein